MTAAARAGRGRPLSLLGCRFGQLTVIGMDEKRGANGAIRWRCRCDCGRERAVAGSLLINGSKTHCGCQTRRDYAFVDIAGQKFHRLTALYRLDKRDRAGYVIWHCRCDCGNEVDVSYNALVHANMKSCGCQKKEHDRALAGYLTHVAGTSIDMLKSSKLPANNSTGVKGVYLVKGKYVAKIVFQKKQYVLGTFRTLEEAAQVRHEAEERINEQVVSFYSRWKAKAEQEPEWAKRNPVSISVERGMNGEIRLLFQPNLVPEQKDSRSSASEHASSFILQV